MNNRLPDSTSLRNPSSLRDSSGSAGQGSWRYQKFRKSGFSRPSLRKLGGDAMSMRPLIRASYHE